MTAAANPPRLSCRLEILPGDTVMDQVSSAREFGFDGITLPGRFMNRWLKPLRECVRDSPLPMVAISLGFKRSLLSPNESERQECRDSLMRLFDLCAELGASIVNVPPCLIQDNPDRVRDPGHFPSLDARLDDQLMKQLPALGDAARQRNVMLLIEPVNKYESEHLNSIEHAARLCRELDHPAVGFTADFFHMQIEELNPPGALLRVGPKHLRHVHIAENTRVEPGPGSLDFLAGFQALKAIGYAGWIELECRALSGAAAEVLPRSVDFIRTTWRKA